MAGFDDDRLNNRWNQRLNCLYSEFIKSVDVMEVLDLLTDLLPQSVRERITNINRQDSRSAANRELLHQIRHRDNWYPRLVKALHECGGYNGLDKKLCEDDRGPLLPEEVLKLIMGDDDDDDETTLDGEPDVPESALDHDRSNNECLPTTELVELEQIEEYEKCRRQPQPGRVGVIPPPPPPGIRRMQGQDDGSPLVPEDVLKLVIGDDDDETTRDGEPDVPESALDHDGSNNRYLPTKKQAELEQMEEYEKCQRQPQPRRVGTIPPQPPQGLRRMQGWDDGSEKKDNEKVLIDRTRKKDRSRTEMPGMGLEERGQPDSQKTTWIAHGYPTAEVNANARGIAASGDESAPQATEGYEMEDQQTVRTQYEHGAAGVPLARDGNLGIDPSTRVPFTQGLMTAPVEPTDDAMPHPGAPPPTEPMVGQTTSALSQAEHSAARTALGERRVGREPGAVGGSDGTDGAEDDGLMFSESSGEYEFHTYNSRVRTTPTVPVLEPFSGRGSGTAEIIANGTEGHDREGRGGDVKVSGRGGGTPREGNAEGRKVGDGVDTESRCYSQADPLEKVILRELNLLDSQGHRNREVIEDSERGHQNVNSGNAYGPLRSVDVSVSVSQYGGSGGVQVEEPQLEISEDGTDDNLVEGDNLVLGMNAGGRTPLMAQMVGREGAPDRSGPGSVPTVDHVVPRMKRDPQAVMDVEPDGGREVSDAVSGGGEPGVCPHVVVIANGEGPGYHDAEGGRFSGIIEEYGRFEEEASAGDQSGEPAVIQQQGVVGYINRNPNFGEAGEIIVQILGSLFSGGGQLLAMLASYYYDT